MNELKVKLATVALAATMGITAIAGFYLMSGQASAVTEETQTAEVAFLSLDGNGRGSWDEGTDGNGRGSW